MNRTETIRNLRDKLANQIADEFEESGIEYTCGAVVKDFARSRIIPLTDTDEFKPFLAHSMLTFRKIEMAVRDEVHNRWKERNGF